MTDQERIEAIMSHYNLNNVGFCTKVGLNQATLSNILGGRTNPSLTVLRNIVDAFSEINPNWVFMGTGEMLKSDDVQPESDTTPSYDDADLFSAIQKEKQIIPSQAASSTSFSESSRHGAPASKSIPAVSVEDIVSGVVTQLKKPVRKIIEVRVFFDDGTFEAFS